MNGYIIIQEDYENHSVEHREGPARIVRVSLSVSEL